MAVSCRVYLGYHTLAQVMYGAVLGGGVAVLWFSLVQVSGDDVVVALGD